MGVPDLLSAEFDADPYAAYRVLRRDHPVLYHEPTDAYLISRYQDVAAAFRDQRVSSRNYEWQTQPVHGRTILQMEGKEHASYRAIVNPMFRGQSLEQRIVPTIDRMARRQIAGFAADGEVDLAAQFSNHYPIAVIVELLDLPAEDVPRFYDWYQLIMGFIANFEGDEDKAAGGLHAREQMTEYLMPRIAERRAAPGRDLLSAMCVTEVDGMHMSDDEIRAFCSLLLVAGGETTEKAITLTMRNLVDHPEQLADVRADRSLVPRAFAETLRYTGPVQMILRHAEEDLPFSGGKVPAGHTLDLLLGSANRDPEHFARAEVFDIHRPDLDFQKAFTAAANHVEFALGPHFCLGSHLSRAEVVVALNALLDAMEDIELAAGWEPAESGIYTRGLASLELTFTPA